MQPDCTFEESCIGDALELSVMLIAEDEASERMASDFLGRICVRLGDEYQIRQRVWKGDDFSSEETRLLAADCSRQADIVVIALQAGSPLSGPLEGWIRYYLPKRNDRKGALVALLRQTSKSEFSESPSVSTFLEQLASSARMDFFCQAVPAAICN
jgi:hypothetical protein